MELSCPHDVANFCSRIDDAAGRFAANPAVELAGATAPESRTYGELRGDAARAACWLRAHGLAPGDRCAILAANSPAWIAGYLGVLRLGAIVVPLDTAYKAAQVRTILESSGARVLLTSPAYRDTCVAACAGFTPPIKIALLDDVRAARDARSAARDAPDVPVTPVGDDEPAVILYTSGTTADPKGVVLTHANLDAERLAVLSIVKATERDAVLGVLPLFHALAQMANLLLPLSVGARVVFLETVSSTTLLEALQSKSITIFACVPQFFYLIHQRVTAELSRAGALRRSIARGVMALNLRLRDTLGVNPGKLLFARVHHALGPSMRVLVTGGSRFDPAIGRDLYAMGFTLQNAYGLTETSGGATLQRPGDRFTTSVGQPLPGVEVRIAGDGEILIRGPIVMREYFNRPDATRDAIVDGWLLTGDLGQLDAQNRLFITGRKKEIIVLSSGKNLYPEEIEGHYLQSPFFKEMCVLGLARPGEPSAERLHAVVVPDADAMRERGIVNVRELVRFHLETLSVQLPAHKRVLSYDVSLEPLPRTTTGKLKRREIEREVLARAASAAQDADRPLTDAEREWLAGPGHADAMAQIASRLDRAEVRPEANLELDLGLDSMERVELLTALERRAGRRVAAADRAAIFTARQLVEAVLAAPSGEMTSGIVSDASGETIADVISPRDDWEAILAAAPDERLIAPLRKPKRLTVLFFFLIGRVIRAGAAVLIGFRVHGAANIPRRGPFIIAPNHVTSIDPIFVVCALPLRIVGQLFFVGAAEYFATRFSAWFARTVNVIPVDPDANLVTAMQAGAAGLRLGRVLILFPEGERSIDGRLKPFRKGAAILSAHLQAPIVPAALEGLYELWPRGRRFNWSGLLPWRATRASVTFGEPIAPAADYQTGTDAVRRSIERLLH
jgi:long-chain acyl-CoA synthetase